MISSTGVAIAGATVDSRARSPGAGPSGTPQTVEIRVGGWSRGGKCKGEGEMCGCLSRRPAAIFHS